MMDNCVAVICFFCFLISSVKGCGEPISASRIVGGVDSGGYHYPWFALLRLKVNGDPPVCAGSLITDRHVLSAAHCFTVDPSKPNEELFTVALGVYDRCDATETTKQVFGVIQVQVHEKYQKGSKFYDIALMTLDRRAGFTTVCLPPPGRGDKTEPALLIGFGVTEQGGRQSPCHMMEAQVLKLSKRDCGRTLLPQQDVREDSVFCAGNVTGGVDSCQGDSGGPLMTNLAARKFAVAGIVSYGYGCGNPGLPGVYTNVAYYYNWIQQRLRSMPTNEVRGINTRIQTGAANIPTPITFSSTIPVSVQSNSPQSLSINEMQDSSRKLHRPPVQPGAGSWGQIRPDAAGSQYNGVKLSTPGQTQTVQGPRIIVLNQPVGNSANDNEQLQFSGQGQTVQGPVIKIQGSRTPIWTSQGFNTQNWQTSALEPAQGSTPRITISSTPPTRVFNGNEPFMK